MRKYFCPKSKNHLFKGSVFVTFSKKEFAEEFVNKPELKYKEKELLRYTQGKYMEIKKKEREEAEIKKKAKKEAKEAAAADTKECSLPKSAVVHFTLGEGDITREDIKERISEIESSLEIAFVHFQKGDKEGDLRFNKENNGKTLMEKLEGGKVSEWRERSGSRMLNGFGKLSGKSLVVEKDFLEFHERIQALQDWKLWEIFKLIKVSWFYYPEVTAFLIITRTWQH